MPYYKALISKRGEILSLSEEQEPDPEPSSVDMAAGSKYPDVIFITAAGYDEATEKVNEILRQAERAHTDDRS